MRARTVEVNRDRASGRFKPAAVVRSRTIAVPDEGGGGGARLRPLASLDAGQTAAGGVDAVVLPESESGAYRLDRRLRAPKTTSQVDRQLAQHLLDGFLAAGAKVVFVGLSTGLRGPHVVVPYPSHENHMHVRFPTPPG